MSTPSSYPGGKEEKDLDLSPWLSPEHPPIMQLVADIPRGARATDKARVRRYLGRGAQAGGSRDVSFSDKEFAAHVVAKQLGTVTELLAWVMNGADNLRALRAEERSVVVGMDSYCFKNQRDLAQRLAFVWGRHSAPRALAAAQTSAWGEVLAAQQRPSVCAGRWTPLTESLLKLHCQVYPSSAPAAERPLSDALRDFSPFPYLVISAHSHT